MTGTMARSTMVGVAIPLNNDARILDALAIAVVIVETASGIAVHGPTFTEWVRESMGGGETQRRRFGSATASVSEDGGTG